MFTQTIKDLENDLATDKSACSELEKKLRELQLKVARVNSIREVRSLPFNPVQIDILLKTGPIFAGNNVM